MNIVKCKWVFKAKHGPNGELVEVALKSMRKMRYQEKERNTTHTPS